MDTEGELKYPSVRAERVAELEAELEAAVRKHADAEAELTLELRRRFVLARTSLEETGTIAPEVWAMLEESLDLLFERRGL